MALLGLVACATTTTSPVARRADPAFARKVVTYPTPVPPGTIVIDPSSHFLYLVQGGGQAIRYGVGVGGEGFGWSGSATVHNKQEWPDWYPPPNSNQNASAVERWQWKAIEHGQHHIDNQTILQVRSK
jgi:lipoprotein-anchoring transpeptidase ErfK/SrfK